MFPVTEGNNVKIKSEEISKKILKLKILWHFCEILKIENPAESIWNNFIFPVKIFSVTEGSVKFNSEEILKNKLKLTMIWRFFEKMP